MQKSSEFLEGGYPSRQIPEKEKGKKSYLEGVTSVKWKEEVPEKRKKWSTGKKIGAVGIAFAVTASPIAVIEALEAIGVSNVIIQKYEAFKKMGLETSKEALDKFTQATGIKFFGSEKKTTSTISAEAPFTGLEIQGLNHVWQNNRWEYVDPNDSLVAGYWNDKEGRFELTGKVLRSEWSGLFVPKMTADIEKILAEKDTKEDWTVAKWESGEAKIAIPFMITKGGTIEEVKVTVPIPAPSGFRKTTALLVTDLPLKTTIVCPFYQIDSQSGSLNKPYDIRFRKGEVVMEFIVPQKNDMSYYLDTLMHKIDPQTHQSEKIKLGTPVMELGNNETLSAGYLVPFVVFSKDLSKAQLLIKCFEGTGNGYEINTSLKNFLTDDKGRFVFTITQPILEEPINSQQSQK